MAKAKKSSAASDDVAYLLKYLLVLELHRAGLSLSEIRARLRMDKNVVNHMLKGVRRQKEVAAE